MFSSFRLFQTSKPSVNPMDELAQFETAYLQRHNILPNFAMVHPDIFILCAPAFEDQPAAPVLRGLHIASRKTIARNTIALAFDDEIPTRPLPQPAQVHSV